MVDAAAYADCVRLAGNHYENFPVASLLLPPDARPHIAAIYAFARGADDIADEGAHPAADRLAALQHWQSWLHRAVEGAGVDAAGPHARLFEALAQTIRRYSLPLPLFDDLVAAFAQDVVVKRYETWRDLLAYCRRSANPVGRLVLRVCGHADGALDDASDRICTALQLTNFWQDVARDWAIGRLYIPAEIWRGTGAEMENFEPMALTDSWRQALAVSIGRTRTMFNEGRAICDGVSGRLRYELRLTWLGGMRILERVDARSDAAYRPTLGARDAGPLLWRFLTWTRSS